jgi:shikimate kinase
LRLFIIGYKSSGKTTLGKKLAERLKLTFIDLDECIEQREGKTIPEIFLETGEEEFRRKEREALIQVVKMDNILVSTGGGVPCHSDNMSLMEKHGDVIYLKVDDETLISRLKIAASHRPVVKGKSESELRAYLAELRQRCEHQYLRARFVVDGNKAEIKEILEQLTKEKRSDFP